MLGKYFQDVKPWIMDEKKVQAVEDNEHLGKVVSGKNQEEKKSPVVYLAQDLLSSVC